MKKLCTGTKEEFLALFKEINEPTRKFQSPGKARIDYAHAGVGYGNRIAGMEGFSRILWGAGPGIGLLSEEWVTEIARGITNGTNPEHPEYWGEIHDRDQRMVEMPALALALGYQERLLWQRLSQGAQENLLRWLSQILEYQCADGNWQFFKVIVGTVLADFEYPFNQAEYQAAFQRIEDCYVSGGWYQDSSRGRQDYYNPFAFHYYGLIYSRLRPLDPRGQVYVQRASEFAQDYQHFFAEDGANLPFGRSLTYRFAVSCFWSALIWSGQQPFSLAKMKGILLRNLNWWQEKDLFDGNGLLTIGYTYSQLSMSENYNSSLSSYWLNKLFLLLDLPADHPFWQVTPADYEQLEDKVMPQMNGLFHHGQGHTVLLNAGQPGPNFHVLTNEKYLKFAYSTYFGFSVGRANQLKEEAAMDSMLGIQRQDTLITTSRGGQTVQEVGQFLVRNQVEDVVVTSDFVASTWRPTQTTRIRTWLLVCDDWQIRIHRLNLAADYTLYETGFAAPCPPEEAVQGQNGAGYSYFSGARGFTGILDLGKEKLRDAAGVYCAPNTSLMTMEPTYLPGLQQNVAAGEHWLVTVIYATPDQNAGLLGWQQPPVITFLDATKVVIKGRTKQIINLVTESNGQRGNHHDGTSN